MFAKNIQESRRSDVTKHEVWGSDLTRSNAARGQLRKGPEAGLDPAPSEQEDLQRSVALRAGSGDRALGQPASPTLQ